MKKGYKKLLCFIAIIIIILFIGAFNHNFFSGYKIDLFLIILLILFNLFFVIEKDNHRYMNDILFEIMFYVIIYFILFYLLGLVVGLSRTSNYMTLYGINTFIIPTLFYSILREIFRYNMLCKSDGSKICTVMVILLFIIFELCYKSFPLRFNSQYDILKYVALTLLPVIAKNLSYTYISKKMGFKPIIIFDLIFSLYPYLIPILPNPSVYIMSVICILVPVVFAFRIVRFFEYKKDNVLPSNYHKKKFSGILLPVITIFAMVYIYSGYFRFYAVAIASGSMEPKIHIGDVVIIDQKFKKNDLKKGTIIAFKHNDVIVVHRIYKKIKLDGNDVYYTKGDANNHIDNFLTEEKAILGTVESKIPVIGYPTVWFNKERK